MIRSLMENKSIYYDNLANFSDKLPIIQSFYYLILITKNKIQAPIESWTKQWLELSDRNYCIITKITIYRK